MNTRTLFSSLAKRVASEMSVDLEAEAEARLLTWLELLHQWNQRIDLSAARNDEELVDLCLADAFAMTGVIPQGSRVVDVGSGAGAPGLPLALLRPDLDMTLVEPAAKRVSFLRTVIGTIGTKVTVVRGRGEDLIKATPNYDLAVSRATLAPEAWLGLGSKLVLKGQGRVIVMLAREEPPVWPDTKMVSRMHYEQPLTGAKRNICIYEIG